MTLAAVEFLVRERIGLDPASLGPAALARAVAVRSHARGTASPAAYAGLVTAEPGEWAALVGELVVPETWFFRGGHDFFAHLARRVRERSAGRALRVLSVPCSTGEEPYSLAIALEAQGVPPARCAIDAVDLSPAHLLRAIAGRYTASAFREPGPDPRPKYFHAPTAGVWELSPVLRERVRFRPGNLVDPGFLAAESPYDVILCRNLFIYLTDDARRRAVANLDRLLAADGWLCLTPAEADRLPAGRFVSDGPPAFSTFRRSTAPAAAAPPIPVPPRYVHQPLPPIVPPVAVAPPASRETGGRGDRAAAEPDPLRIGRELADAGRLDEARAVCERALAAGPPTAGAFSLLGVVHRAAGRPHEAADAFHKALYLDPGHVEALTHLSVLFDQLNEPARAARLRRQLARAEREARA